ncbi:diguanylate cyclase [Vibrio sp. D404a]|uniref:sensor domain-containing diguanylate cyclase n=1 Tax=unclassified Vibrio TaxID=2614977 RepID=UPI0025531F51|nr:MULTISPECIES: diguanylate cyclase [unclassified Vibrio]MDK9735966.1 diguanylate cyclase [Vibrio sp. D404a]MDK9797868.1 diguanylate cyclase [Vibrio sp. D449a]
MLEKMEISLPSDFFESILNSLLEQIAIIDATGSIVFVNQSWKDFGTENDGDNEIEWRGINYLDCCGEETPREGEQTVKQGIQRVISGETMSFTYEYPCHSPNTQRWFLMRVTPLTESTLPFYVITHQNITDRKNAEILVAQASEQDPLTGIANRRKFEAFANEHWMTYVRERTPVSIIMIDIDFFKKINDSCGHAFGDECLVRVTNILSQACRRTTDLCARYGGEEFVVFLGNTPLSGARKVAEWIIFNLRNMKIFECVDIDMPYLSVSIGITTSTPDCNTHLNDLVQEADNCLYEAKRNGRDRIEYSSNVISESSQSLKSRGRQRR